jgi:DNA-binding NarL/FixJ family response regulator
VSDGTSIGVAVVEDRPELRELLQSLLETEPGFTCAGTYGSMEAALSALRPPELDVDVALIDIGLPGMSGIEGIGVLRHPRPELPMLVLTIYHDNERIFEALCAGACGYLLKNTPPERLIEALREAKNGGSPMTPEVARKVVTLFREFRPPPRAEYDLTPHEQRILKLLVEGHSYKTAAIELAITPHTVSFHLRRIYEKLEVHSKSEAVAKALRERLIS